MGKLSVREVYKDIKITYLRSSSRPVQNRQAQ
jgi:hypothetical protein